jgi:hypothetical protein
MLLTTRLRKDSTSTPNRPVDRPIDRTTRGGNRLKGVPKTAGLGTVAATRAKEIPVWVAADAVAAVAAVEMAAFMKAVVVRAEEGGTAAVIAAAATPSQACGRGRSLRKSFRPATFGRPNRSTRITCNGIPTATLAISFGLTGKCRFGPTELQSRPEDRSPTVVQGATDKTAMAKWKVYRLG